MAEKKTSTRSGAPGGERPMRRRDSRPETRGAARDDTRGKKPAGASFDKPGPGKGTKGAKDARNAKGGAKPRPEPRRKTLPAPVERTSGFEGERVAKAMARAGVCSRRDAEDWIAAGRVAVNGRVLTSPAVNVTEADAITIDGAPMQARERTRLFLFHKPGGYVTTAHDPEGRATVFAFLEERHPDLPRLVSVGRLDINTEGLLLLTNDGGLARTLELPATGWTRRYRVRAHGDIDQARLDELRKGVTVDDVTYGPIEARLERVQGANAWIAMSLNEGKNREIKRVMEHLGLDVTRLIRVSYGPFQLGELAEGAVEEVKLKVLRDQLGKSLAELAGVDFASPLREATAAEQQEQRQRIDRRARKHVSVLRKERDELGEKGPRARIERSATADRKGRAVAVERVTPTRRKSRDEEAPASRNAKRFEAIRGRAARDEGAAERPARAARGPRAEFPRQERESGRGGEGDRARRAPDSRPSRERASGTGHSHARSSERAGTRDEARFEKRPPRRDRDETRAPRGGDERLGNFERPRGAPRGERGADERAGARGRAPARAGGRDAAPFEKRPPRRDQDGSRPARAPRGGDERPKAFDRPRGARPPRAEGARAEGAARSGKGPLKGRGAGPARGPGGGLGKGPGRGPGRGPAGAPRGPRKPRGS